MVSYLVRVLRLLRLCTKPLSRITDFLRIISYYFLDISKQLPARMTGGSPCAANRNSVCWNLVSNFIKPDLIKSDIFDSVTP